MRSLPIVSSTPSSLSSSSGSTTSSTSADSSDGSASESSDSSSFESSGSSSTPPTSASCKRASVPQTQTAHRTSGPPSTTGNTAQPTKTVPPGKGKPSTHSRNMRRRAKKMATVSTATIIPGFVSETNATRAARPDVAEPDVEAERRAKARQGRIRGPAPDVASALNNAFGGNERVGRLDPGDLDAESVSSSTLHTPLYPPSEAEEALNVQMLSMFPKSKNKNKSRRGGEEVDPRSRKIVFGTPPPPLAQSSFDDNEGENAPRRRPALIPPSLLPAHLIPANVFITCVDVEEGLKKSKKKKRRVEETDSWLQDETVDSIMLDYGEVPAEPQAEHAIALLDFDAAPAITSYAQLSEGCIIGYMGLIINMKSFTPEMGKRYGRVLGWREDSTVTIRPISEGEEDTEDEELEWAEVQGAWKLLQ
ncbi:hypothetical protein DFH07DRAFT_585965 [Mycena maculata]|uniref:Uncharacterized protein n=1 Tax=Mycena maculata TaxID=230809 RepID=A0AAD7IN59_9AGAR|nr:hypothetical protein DFH07DRAFT_585965 [Mycena maculata]